MLGAYQRMLPRLQAEETQRLISVALAAGGRSMSDEDRTTYMRELDAAAVPAVERRRAPRVTPAFARMLTDAAARQR